MDPGSSPGMTKVSWMFQLYLVVSITPKKKPDRMTRSGFLLQGLKLARQVLPTPTYQ
jgi:hypothetical protein